MQSIKSKDIQWNDRIWREYVNKSFISALWLSLHTYINPKTGLLLSSQLIEDILRKYIIIIIIIFSISLFVPRITGYMDPVVRYLY